jgi:hypothetical protein
VGQDVSDWCPLLPSKLYACVGAAGKDDLLNDNNPSLRNSSSCIDPAALNPATTATTLPESHSITPTATDVTLKDGTEPLLGRGWMVEYVVELVRTISL